MDLSNILYLDTESSPETKKPECIQWLKGRDKGIIDTFTPDTFRQVKELWDNSSAIVFFNAPYDMGALTIFYPQNSYQWIVKNINGERSASWKLTLFDNIYDVRRISFFRNLIKPYNRVKTTLSHKEKGIKSTPVIDLLKLWSILINDDESISLKALIKRELHREAIEYTSEVSRTEAYRLQDVEALRDLTELFFTEKIKEIEELKSFTLYDWSYIKTPATFTKILYKSEYRELKEYQKNNNQVLSNYNLDKAFESAFHGGITLSMHRGIIQGGAWVDIRGAYSKAIEVLNTDSYLQFGIERTDILQWEEPQLIRISTNFILKSMNKSLKLFYTEEKIEVWIMNYDIIACNNLIDDYQYDIIEIFDIVPGLPEIKESIPTRWNRLKDIEKSEHGKTTLYNFYKYLSNTSYGIKAQRKPFITEHTNMVIACMITSKVHQILTTIIKVVRKEGHENKYNDTDSSLIKINGRFKPSLINRINTAISPFEVEHEGNYEKTIILSLKRYISIFDVNEYSKTGIGKHDKIKLHGKGRYKINMSEIAEYVLTRKLKKDEYLVYGQMSANTEISMNQILKIYPFLEDYKHPFMFVKNVKTDVLKSYFLNRWYNHIDTKTGWEQNKKEFKRSFHIFKNIRYAEMFFKNYEIDNAEDINMCFRDWDKELLEDFEIKLVKTAKTMKRPKKQIIEKDLFDYESYHDSSLTDNENKQLEKDRWKDFK